MKAFANLNGSKQLKKLVFGVGFSLIVGLGGGASQLLGDTESPQVNPTEPFVQACFQFDGQPRRCQYFGCFYNYRNNRCVGGGGGGGGGGRNYWICEARDAGFEEHFRGHSASGWTRFQAQNAAIRQCQGYHDRCYITNCYTN